ncbi:uncharacterized protein N7459_004061 [Penicillium hispanicum]|uniref:uncharacterized protein n=1 Tax=Penicillium hispanicum TaxID=1080232 RepID=UPI0025413006|nr:uncharacterized protein N7459_004061 [Penicillium hispanicum]KAJ5584261.1 hypothetical protein N7459_004061 [Penicillium hispanicum]
MPRLSVHTELTEVKPRNRPGRRSTGLKPETCEIIGTLDSCTEQSKHSGEPPVRCMDEKGEMASVTTTQKKNLQGTAKEAARIGQRGEVGWPNDIIGAADLRARHVTRPKISRLVRGFRAGMPASRTWIRDNIAVPIRKTLARSDVG